jgi:hypothetical protein
MTLDGAQLGEAPILSRALVVGSHTVVLVKLETGASRARRFDVEAGKQTKLVVSF